MNRITLALCGFSIALLAPGVAGAQSQPHFHDGFYLRLGVGGGYLSDSASGGGFSGTISGGGIAGELAIGGTPSPGLVIGGASQGFVAFSPTFKSGSQTINTDGNTSLGMQSLGPFIDYYFDPTAGFHIQGMVGIGDLNYSHVNADNTTTSSTSKVGFAFGAGIGNEWWISDNWGLGLLGRFNYVNAKDSDTSAVTNSAVAFSLLFTATYH